MRTIQNINVLCGQNTELIMLKHVLRIVTTGLRMVNAINGPFHIYHKQ